MPKLLLLGAGRWGSLILRSLTSLVPPADLWVVDPSPAALESALQAGVRASQIGSDHQAFIECVDAAIIATPAASHFALAADCLTAGLDVLVEKPMTETSDQARVLVDLARQHHRLLQVGHILRFDPAVEWLKSAIDTGHFGQIRLLRLQLSGFKRPGGDGGITFGDAVHGLDLFQHLLGRSPARLTAHIHDLLGRGDGQDDACLVSLEYPTELGLTWGVVESNYFSPRKTRELTVVGSNLSAVCDFTRAEDRLVTFAHRHRQHPGGLTAETGPETVVTCSPAEPLRAELAAFLAAIESRQPAPADGLAGLESLRLLEAALVSAREGRTFTLE